MKKTIFLIDGGFFSKLYNQQFNRYPDSNTFIKFIKAFNETYNKSIEIFRIYYYDCYPLDKRLHLPITNKVLDLKRTPRFSESNTFLDNLKREDFVSVREGSLNYSGWKLKRTGLNKIKEAQALTDDDFAPNINQKGVDTKIGLDMAWISLNSIAERVVLVTGDADFVPAVKFARRNGVQVILSTLGSGVNRDLLNNSDKLITDSLGSILPNIQASETTV